MSVITTARRKPTPTHSTPTRAAKQPLSQTPQPQLLRTPDISAGRKATKRMLRKLDLNTRYYRIVVWNADKEVQWLIQCRPEFEARCYARAVNEQAKSTGYRAKLVPIHLPRLPSYPLGKLD